jgi:hypothetical protein
MPAGWKRYHARVDRREFLIRSGWTTGAVALAPIRALGRAPLDGVAIVAPAAASPATAAAPAWARDLVAQALTARGYTVRTIARVADARADELCITSDVRAVANRPRARPSRSARRAAVACWRPWAPTRADSCMR